MRPQKLAGSQAKLGRGLTRMSTVPLISAHAPTVLFMSFVFNDPPMSLASTVLVTSLMANVRHTSLAPTCNVPFTSCVSTVYIVL